MTHPSHCAITLSKTRGIHRQGTLIERGSSGGIVVACGRTNRSSMLLRLINGVLIILLVYVNLASTSNDYRIWCYTGLKYVIGQEERQDAEECTSFLGLKQYCYRFTAYASVEEVIKLGCSSTICAGLRNVCTELDFMGIKGTMCCCNDTSYCNNSSTYSFIGFYLFIGTYFLRLILS
uniref:Activin_recp domain-containing protein n=1 Tax=Panagrellus redivivus TaxID=6233 RepID=A0A7E4ZWP3_PANRE